MLIHIFLMQMVHGSLLQRSHQALDNEKSDIMDMTQMPLALREAAFFESADCYTAMIANKEVSSLPCCFHPLQHPLTLRASCITSPSKLLLSYYVEIFSIPFCSSGDLVSMCRHTGGC